MYLDFILSKQCPFCVCLHSLITYFRATSVVSLAVPNIHGEVNETISSGKTPSCPFLALNLEIQYVIIFHPYGWNRATTLMYSDESNCESCHIRLSITALHWKFSRSCMMHDYLFSFCKERKCSKYVLSWKWNRASDLLFLVQKKVSEYCVWFIITREL